MRTPGEGAGQKDFILGMHGEEILQPAIGGGLGTGRSVRLKVKLKTTLCSVLLAACCVLGHRTFAIEITEPAGAEHGSPGLCDITGKKLADGEFRQWVEDNRLHVVMFIKVPDTHIWLTTPKPAGFLRWEGPIVLPNDPMIRVDLVSDSVSGPAEPAK